jgi:hemerythrin
MALNKLEWEDSYSVGVQEIDEQHKKLFSIINELLKAVDEKKSDDNFSSIIEELVNYKTYHFQTEEKYFKLFNYEETDKHIASHRFFNDELGKIVEKHHKYDIYFAYDLVEFLENWLVDHLMVEDQKYKQCFSDNGLK